MSYPEYDESNFTDTGNNSFSAYKAKYPSPVVAAAAAPPVQYSAFANQQKGAASPWDIQSTPSGKSGVYDELGNVTSPGVPEIGGGADTPWYQDGRAMQGYAQLGGLAMQLVGYKDQKKLLKTQTAGLQQNISQNKANFDFREKAKAGINRVVRPNTGIA